MAVCPQCDKEIDSLKYREDFTGYAYGTVSLTHNENYLDYDYEDEEKTGSNISEYNCPECDVRLFRGSQSRDAIAFLKGNQNTQKPTGIFLCERHNIRFDDSCPKCKEV